MGGSFEPGEVFAERYVIEAQLGVGAAGVVLSATHVDLKQRVAIKLLRDTAPVGVERMVREARAALSLHSEHIVRVMDVGRDREGRAYIVMEQLEGSDLGTLLQQRGNFSVVESVDYVLQACAGIAEAHARGIVHRDLKPSNLFLTQRADGAPLVKVLDFGISKTCEDQDAESSLTGPAEMIGSPRYMSPEQVRGARDVDHRADIWALGIILFRFLSGIAPFGGKGKGITGALTSIVMDDPPSLVALVPAVPVELEAVVLRCLAKAPENRPQSTAELSAQLAPFGSGEGRAAVARLLRSIQGRPSSEAPTKPPPPVATPLALRPRRVVVAGLVAASIAIPAVAFAVLGRHGGPATEAPRAVAVASPVAPAAEPMAPAAAPVAAPAEVTASDLPVASPPVHAAPAAAHRAPPARVAAPAHPRTAPAPAAESVVRSAAIDDRY
jgi:eukaryotic-like serine/threonine-protein kinase